MENYGKKESIFTLQTDTFWWKLAIYHRFIHSLGLHYLGLAKRKMFVPLEFGGWIAKPSLERRIPASTGLRKRNFKDELP